MNTQTTPASQLALQQPSDPTAPLSPEAGSAADKNAEGGEDAPPTSSAEVIKKTVEAASQAAKPSAATPKAAKPAAQPLRRRGPPADGAPEVRVLAIAATSKMSDANGVRIRRGAVVSVPERRVSALLTAAKIRKASAGELEIARRRHGEFEIR